MIIHSSISLPLTVGARYPTDKPVGCLVEIATALYFNFSFTVLFTIAHTRFYILEIEFPSSAKSYFAYFKTVICPQLGLRATVMLRKYTLFYVASDFSLAATKTKSLLVFKQLRRCFNSLILLL